MSMKKQSLLGRFLLWRVRHISDRNFLLMLSVVVGLAVGFAAVVIKNSVFFIQSLLTSGFTINYQNYLYFIYPAVGLFAVVIFIRFIIKQSVGHGIPSVLYAISKNNGQIKRHNIFTSIITSALTVGFGGSVGLEGPTVATGGAIGSNLGRALHLNSRQITQLVGFACAGAMSAIFKAPITAIVFVLEVIMIDMTMSALVPLLMASVSAALTSYFFLGQDVLYPFEIKEKFMIGDVHFYILFGVFAGLVSVYFTRMYVSIERVFSRIKSWYYKLLAGGLSLGILIFFLPSLYGEGYEAINSCLNGNYGYLFDNSIFYIYKNNEVVILGLILLIILTKIIATSVTFGSGGVGGIFAPTLFMGANTGLFFAKTYNYFDIGHISESNFALVGMAGLISGVLHAPLTAIFLIAEITGGYGLFLPLMIVSVISYVTIRIFEKNSVYTIQLAARGELITHHKDKATLMRMQVKKLIETNFSTINADASLGDLVKVVSDSHRNVFPVVDKDKTFLGIVFLDDIRHIMFKPEMYDNTYVRNLMFMPDIIVQTDESMEEVAQKFHKSGKYNLPVLKDDKYVGFISRANVFSAYRKLLKEFSED
ncbi:MAG: chloride channel protein [Bacteroidales bacterium]|nr:chloride channel protein [Bacteroidales bacterium]